MTGSITASPSEKSNRVASSTDVMGSASMTTHMGSPGSPSDTSPQPVSASNPTKTSVPIPADNSPGSSPAECRPAEAGGLHQQEGAEDRRPQQGADRGEAPGRRHHRGGLGGYFTPREAYRAQPEPPAQGDQRRLRPEHAPSARVASAASTTPDSSNGRGAPPGTNPSAGS